MEVRGIHNIHWIYISFISNKEEIYVSNRVTTKREAEAILSYLSEQYPFFKINFDLEDCDNILRVEGSNFTANDIIEHLGKLKHICKSLE